jgi:hypothetical protein
MLTTARQKFRLQLINPNELPDQICLFLAYILPQPHLFIDSLTLFALSSWLILLLHEIVRRVDA